MRNFNKVVVTLTAVTATAGLVGAGTYANWTQTVTATPQNVASGTFGVQLGGAGLQDTLTTGASNIAPGDTIARPVALSNNGTTDFKTVTFDVTATANDPLVDGPNSLMLKVEKCTQAWTGSNSGGWNCPSGATKTTVVADHTIDEAVNPVDIAGAIDADTAAASGLKTDHLLATVTLPAANSDYTADGGQTVQLTYTFAATQRDGVHQ